MLRPIRPRPASPTTTLSGASRTSELRVTESPHAAGVSSAGWFGRPYLLAARSR
jgi:hypothetical protein